MLVDDNYIDLRINAKIISLANNTTEIITCCSAEESLNYLKKHAEDVEKLPNFILLDIQMPEMNGFEFLEEFKQLSQTTIDKCTIIMLSSTLDFGDIQRAQANPYVSKLINKPLTIEKLKDGLT